jgi:Bacterial Ig domain
MAKWSEMKGGAKSALVVVVALLFGGGGYGVWKANQPVMAPVAEGTEAAASSETAAPAEAPKVAETAAAPATEPAVEPAAEPATAPKAAGLDVVRVEPDGTATIAGQAEPGATISLQLDGAEIGSAVADAAGKFAALLTLPDADPGADLGGRDRGAGRR